MTSQKIPVKRRLPAWMEMVHNQSKKMSNSAGPMLQVSDQAFSEKVDTKRRKLPFESNKQTQFVVTERATNKPDEETKKDLFFVAGSSNGASSNLSAAQVIEQSMPLLNFKGRIVYSCHYFDCACICEDILTSLSDSNKTPVGFDMEWPVSFHNGSSDKAALIQMCLSENICYLFHISAMVMFPEPLKNLICDVRILLVGLNIEADLWKLEKDYDLRVKSVIDRGSVIDVGRLANKKLKSLERWDLNGLCRNVLKQRLNKDAVLRCGEWSVVPLSKEQKLYAATDAFAGFLLYLYFREARD